MQEALKVGSKAPDFSLLDQDGRQFKLYDLVGKKAIVLYFYPKDFTRYCTEEAHAFRDNYEVFKDAGAEVIGVSSDSVESHRKFASDLNLPYILLSDEGSKVRHLYKVAPVGDVPGRVTFVIDKKGAIRLMFSSMLEPRRHIEEALRIIEEISKE